MAVSQRVQFLTNRSEELSVLLEYLKNPDLIAQLQEETTKLNSLGLEQEKQLHEAKTLIQEREKTTSDLIQLRETMRAEKEVHENSMADRVKETEKWVEEQKQLVASEHTALDARKATAEAEDTRLRQWDSKLKETAATIKGLAG